MTLKEAFEGAYPYCLIVCTHNSFNLSFHSRRGRETGTKHKTLQVVDHNHNYRACIRGG
jgi:hypothetical protein